MTLEQEIELLLSTGQPEDLATAQAILASPYLRFRARPDQPDNGDEMTSFIEDQHPGKIVLGGTGSGKSYSAFWLFAHRLFTNEPPQPNTPVWVLATTFDQVGLLWTDILSRFITKDIVDHYRWRKTELEPEIIRLKPTRRGNSWNIHFHSCDQKREALQAATIWMALIDEQAPQPIIEEVWGRLRKWGNHTKFILSCTPLNPDLWLEDLWDRRHEAAIQGLYRFYRLNTVQNEHLDPDWVKNYLGSLSPDQRATRQFGDFANFKGAVFPEFTSDLIIGPGDHDYEAIKDKINDCEQFIGVDFGFHHPAALWLAREGDTYYIVDEDQLSDAMPDQLAKRVKRRYDHRHKVIVDYEDIISARLFTAAGIRNSPCIGKKVVHSIHLMKDLFWQKRIKVFRNCVQTIRQLRGYRWKDFDEMSDKAEPDQLKPQVVKVRDHLVDCARYVIYSTAKRVVRPWSQPEGGAVSLLPKGTAGVPKILRPNSAGYDFVNRR